MAPSSRAVVCLTTWRTGEQTGARATATLCPRAVRRGNHCHSPDISPGQRWWPRAPAAGLCLSHSLQPNTSRAPTVARGPALNTFTTHPLPSQLQTIRCRWIKQHPVQSYAGFKVLMRWIRNTENQMQLDAGFHASGYKSAVGLHPPLADTHRQCKFPAAPSLWGMDPLYAYRRTHKQAIYSHYTLQTHVWQHVGRLL